MSGTSVTKEVVEVERPRRELDRELLAAEIKRYLAAVDLFRALGQEPTWRNTHGGPV